MQKTFLIAILRSKIVLKKFFLTVALCLILCVCSLGLVGCGEGNYSKEDLAALFTSMQENTSTSQFFDKGEFVVNFDSSKISLSETDKSYIFIQAYDYYLNSASGLFTSVAKRVGLTRATKKFTQEQLNMVYKRLRIVENSLKQLAADKYVFEVSEGNLHYKNVIASYNALIKNLYSLNECFADYYFVKNVGYSDFATEDLADGSVRDMLRYQLLSISKVSFNYELLNFMFSNPLGETKTWYESTTTLKNYISLAKLTLQELDSAENLADHVVANAGRVKTLFANMQDQEFEYEQEYKNFIQGVYLFNVKSYFASTNKPAYISSASYMQQSYFQIIQNFLNGRYVAYTTALQNVLSYM